MPEELLCVDDACAVVPLSRRTIYRLMSSGDLPYYQVASRRLIDRSDLMAYLASVRVPAAS